MKRKAKARTEEQMRIVAIEISGGRGMVMNLTEAEVKEVTGATATVMKIVREEETGVTETGTQVHFFSCCLCNFFVLLSIILWRLPCVVVIPGYLCNVLSGWSCAFVVSRFDLWQWSFLLSWSSCQYSNFRKSVRRCLWWSHRRHEHDGGDCERRHRHRSRSRSQSRDRKRYITTFLQLDFMCSHLQYHRWLHARQRFSQMFLLMAFTYSQVVMLEQQSLVLETSAPWILLQNEQRTHQFWEFTLLNESNRELMW